MAWFKMHQELARHPKLKRFARGLGISRPTAIGHLFLLWSWAMDYAPDGNLANFTPEDIADGAEWGGEAATLIEAMLGCGGLGQAGFLDRADDGTLSMHNWDENCGADFERRKKDAERKRKKRMSVGCPQDVQRMSAVRGEERKGEEREEREEKRGNEKRGEEKRGEETPPPAPAPATGGAIFGNPSDQGPKRQSKSEPPMTPLPDGPFDMKTFMALQEMYWCVGDEYIPDPGAEIRLIQELTEEYPAVPLFQEFRKARAWLEAHPEKVRNDLRLFLRKWVSKAEKQYVQYETVFIPVKEESGGG